MRSRFIPFALLIVLALVFMGDTLTGARIFALRDVIFDAVPWRRFATESLLRGEIPLWNPYSRFGQPFVANPQSAVFYPPHLLFAVLPAATFVSVNIALHLGIAACGMCALARRLGAGAAGALVAGVTYAFGSYMTVNLEFMSVMEVLAWAPLTLVAFHRISEAQPGRGRRLRDIALLGGVIALQILPGNPQPLLYTLLLAAGLVVARRFGHRLRGERRDGERCGGSLVSAGLAITAALTLALGLCALQILPTRELLALSVRAGGVDAGLDIASMHPRHLLSAVLPFVDGRPGAESWHGDVFEFWLGAFHVGIPALALALFAFVPVGRTDVPRWVPLWLGGALVAGLVLAMGRHTFVYPLLLDVVPGFDLLRWPAKALQLVATSLALLAGLGTARLVSLPALRARAIGVGTVAVALVFGSLWLHARQIHATIPGDVLDHRPAALDTFPGEAHERVWIDPLHTAAAYAVYGSRDEADYLGAIDVLAGEIGLPYHLHRTWGGDALAVASAKALTDVLDDPRTPEVEADRVASMASIRWAWTGEPPRWIERPSAYPRAFVGRGDTVGLDVRVGRALPPPDVRGNHLRVVGSIPAGVPVVLTDTWFPGWTGSADGVPLDIVRTNGAFRGTSFLGIRAASEIEMVYAPEPFALGWKISLASLLALLALVGVGTRDTISAEGPPRTE